MAYHSGTLVFSLHVHVVRRAFRHAIQNRGAFASRAELYYSANTSKAAGRRVCLIRNMLEKKLKRSGKWIEEERRMNLRHNRQKCLNLGWSLRKNIQKCHTPVLPCRHVHFTQTWIHSFVIPAQRQNKQIIFGPFAQRGEIRVQHFWLEQAVWKGF